MPSMESLFVNRHDVYAIQTDDGYWALVNEPLTSEVLVRHTEGKLTAGVYQLDTNSEVKWCCLDFDNADAEKDATKAWECAKKTQYAEAVLLETTGGRGYHLWLFFQNRVTARQAKSIAERLIESAGVRCEVFPKQEKLEEGGYGNLVRLPLGIHKKTGLRSKLIEPDDLEKIVPIFIEPEEEPAETGGEMQVHEAYPCWQAMFAGVKEGGRDVVAFTLARRLRTTQGFDEQLCRAALLEWNKKNDPPMKGKEIVAKVKSAYEKEYPNIGCAQIKDSDILGKFCDEERCSRGEKNPPEIKSLSFDDLKELGPRLFEDVKAWLQSMFHFDEPMDATLVTLFVFQTRCYKLLPTVFYLFVMGRAGSGKTCLLNAMAMLGRGVLLGNISVPAMCRELGRGREVELGDSPDLDGCVYDLACYDEYDAEGNAERHAAMDEMLRHGYRRDGAPYVRWDVEKNRAIAWNLYTPKVAAANSTVDAALFSRGFRISATSYGEEDGYSILLNNRYPKRVAELNGLLDLWSAGIAQNFRVEDIEELEKSEEHRHRVATVVGNLGLNRQNEHALTCATICHLIGVDITEELRHGVETLSIAGEENEDDISEFNTVLLDIVANRIPVGAATEVRIKQSVVRKLLNENRRMTDERPLSNKRFAMIRREAGIRDSWLRSEHHAVVWAVPMEYLRILRGLAPQPPLPPYAGNLGQETLDGSNGKKGILGVPDDDILKTLDSFEEGLR